MKKLIKSRNYSGKLSTATKIRRYMNSNPNAKPREVAEALELQRQHVYSYIARDKRKNKSLPVQSEAQADVTWATEVLSVSSDSMLPNFDDLVDKLPPSLASDLINSPEHYKVGGIETIDFIEAKGLGFNLGNVIKYITRADHKGSKRQDLDKAKWYLDREIVRLMLL